MIARNPSSLLYIPQYISAMAHISHVTVLLYVIVYIDSTFHNVVYIIIVTICRVGISLTSLSGHDKHIDSTQTNHVD